MKQTTKRAYAYENEMAKSVGLRMSCNACDRLIYEDENWIEEYSTNGGYCKECAAESLELIAEKVFIDEHFTFVRFIGNMKIITTTDPIDKESDSIAICEAVNNYNTLKQSNKELIEALGWLLETVTANGSIDSVSQEGMIEDCQQILLKAKQL